jgi:hypothetical protein
MSLPSWRVSGWVGLEIAREEFSLLNVVECSSYKIDYSTFSGGPKNATISLNKLVGAARFELTTPCAQGRCATRLRYAPTSQSYQTDSSIESVQASSILFASQHHAPCSRIALVILRCEIIIGD